MIQKRESPFRGLAYLRAEDYGAACLDSGHHHTQVRVLLQTPLVRTGKALVSHGVEACPHARKVLFRALLTQLHPGRSGTLCSRAPNRGGSLSSRRWQPRGKGLRYVC